MNRASSLAALGVAGLLPIIGADVAAAAPQPNPAAAALDALVDADWQYTLANEPETATRFGDHRYDDRWSDLQPAAFAAARAHAQSTLSALTKIDPARLDAQRRITYALFADRARNVIARNDLGLAMLGFSQRSGLSDLAQTADAMPFASVADYDNWLARLHAFPTYAAQLQALLAQAVATKLLWPRVVMQRVQAQLDREIVDDPTTSAFYAPFQRLPAGLADAERAQLQARGKDAITAHVIPAFRRFRAFFVDAYLPAAPETIGLAALPNGEKLYAFLLAEQTTTDRSARDIHETGLREVDRIRAAMEALKTQIGFSGTLAEFFVALRRDKRFFYDSPQALLQAYRATAKRIDPELPRMFRTLPRTPYGVAPIPAAQAPDTTTAYYQPGALDGTRAGTFCVNLYKPEARPIYEMMALALHESVPGHHLQFALASELHGLPAFRRSAYYVAYGEGWGLYAESLGDAMGLYDDPYSKFGALTYEMWRAVRLVVDTGMHAFGWTRDRAIAFFLANTAKTQLDVENEIDRYITDPGQACAYKIGQLEILRLRDHASTTLGSRFDIREFHDVVLRSGSLPLHVLASEVEHWIGEKRHREG